MDDVATCTIAVLLTTLFTISCRCSCSRSTRCESRNSFRNVSACANVAVNSRCISSGDGKLPTTECASCLVRSASRRSTRSASKRMVLSAGRWGMRPASASARSQRVDTPSKRAIGPNGNRFVRVVSITYLHPWRVIRPITLSTIPQMDTRIATAKCITSPITLLPRLFLEGNQFPHCYVALLLGSLYLGADYFHLRFDGLRLNFARAVHLQAHLYRRTTQLRVLDLP
jgi:hypothetical protein